MRRLALAPSLAVLSLLVATPAGAQGPLEPSGRLPPVAPPRDDSPGKPPTKAKPVEPPKGPLPRGAVLEQVSGKVRDVDRQKHLVTIESGDDVVTLSMDRNTMVYTSAGLGTVLDVVPGAQVRAGRNADLVAYWVQVRPTVGKATTGPQPTPGQGTGPGGGSGAAASEPRGGGASGTPVPATPGGGGMP